MRVVVTDVSVFFDLFEIQVLPEFFALEWEIHTTDFVYNEILQANQKEVFEVFERSKRLNILKFSSEEEKQVRNFKTRLSIRSIADKTILWKALQLEATLLTCDRKLRKEAEGHAIEVRGSIWVIEQLVENDVIDSTRGISLLENLKMTNNRLPFDLIDKLIRQWKK
ncbi:MAG: PIN domain-containing protein [Flavobacteriales bacterium]|nr:PIN domain-containing protein [Flavobacteriales bacterium]